ncbi:MAG: signal peptidase I [Ruminococcaceae bacterium]|nr:signal peptidase I [Oscillospiraceae bacterium]
MKTLKKIGSIALDILIILIFLISVLLVVANITADKENGEQANVFGYVINSVQSDSMSGTFEKGSLVVGKMVDDKTVIEKDTIITFTQKVGSTYIQNTHRIVDVQTVGGTNIYQTQGDNRERCPIPDEEWKTVHDVNAVYKFHIPLLGGFIDFLKKPVGFIVCLVLPMLAFIAWQVYKLISLYLQSKKEQMLEEAKDNVSDEAKDAIIREYLAKMQAQTESAEKTSSAEEEIKTENNAENGDSNT